MTSSVQVCVYTLGPVYQDPACAVANQALAPQKKVLNTHTPFWPFPYPSLPFFSFRPLLFSLVHFLWEVS